MVSCEARLLHQCPTLQHVTVQPTVMKSRNRTGSRIDWMKMVGFEIKKYKTWSACFKKTFGYLEQSSLSWLLFRLTTLHFFVMRLCWIFEPFSSTGLHNGIKITHSRNAPCVLILLFPTERLSVKVVVLSLLICVPTVSHFIYNPPSYCDLRGLQPYSSLRT